MWQDCGYALKRAATWPLKSVKVLGKRNMAHTRKDESRVGLTQEKHVATHICFRIPLIHNF